MAYIRPLKKKFLLCNSIKNGLNNAALPYIGNIHKEVCPINFISCFRSDLKEVNIISKHHPTIPQRKKSYIKLNLKGKGIIVFFMLIAYPIILYLILFISYFFVCEMLALKAASNVVTFTGPVVGVL